MNKGILAHQTVQLTRSRHVDFDFLKLVTSEENVPEFAGYNVTLCREQEQSVQPDLDRCECSAVHGFMDDKVLQFCCIQHMPCGWNRPDQDSHFCLYLRHGRSVWAADMFVQLSLWHARVNKLCHSPSARLATMRHGEILRDDGSGDDGYHYCS